MTDNRSKLKLAAGIAIVFFVGVLAGVLGGGIYFEARVEKMFHHGPPTGKKMLERLTEDLDLTASQIEEIQPIIHNFKKNAFELRRQFFPKMKPLLDQLTNQIRTKLNDEQRSKFDKIEQKMDKRFRKGPPPFPPRPGPPGAPRPDPIR